MVSGVRPSPGRGQAFGLLASQRYVERFCHGALEDLSLMQESRRAMKDHPPRQALAEEKIPLLEETASVSTRDIVTGRVRVTTHVETAEEIARADLQSEDVDITRVAIGRPVVGRAPEIRTDGDLTIIPFSRK